MMMLRSRRLLLAIATVFMLACSTTTSAQDQQYNEYGQDEGYSQDGLYADYARQQQIKEAGKAWVVEMSIFLGFFCSELKTIERVNILLWNFKFVNLLSPIFSHISFSFLSPIWNVFRISSFVLMLLLLLDLIWYTIVFPPLKVHLVGVRF